MAKFDDSVGSFQAVDRKAWRNWLYENHQNCQGVWLIYYKVASGKPSIRYQEAVQEALCFGWIDSKIKSFENFNNSTKKSILFWLSNAKRSQTRANRIQKTIDSAMNNKNPLG